MGNGLWQKHGWRLSYGCYRCTDHKEADVIPDVAEEEGEEKKSKKSHFGIATRIMPRRWGCGEIQCLVQTIKSSGSFSILAGLNSLGISILFPVR